MWKNIYRYTEKCKIIFHSSLDTKRKNIVSLKTLKMLEEIGEKVNNNIIIITSTIRYPQQQAEAMYSNLSRGKRIRYRKPGMLVTAVLMIIHQKELPKMK